MMVTSRSVSKTFTTHLTLSYVSLPWLLLGTEDFLTSPMNPRTRQYGAFFRNLGRVKEC